MKKENENNIEKLENFESFNLKEELLRGIYSYGFEYPSEIQAKSIPKILTGRDIVAQAQSGTGKTGAFLISTLQTIDENIAGCQAVIMVHTRELALQIFEICRQLSQYTKINVVLAIGGCDINKTKTELRHNGPTMLIGTPGRTLDLINRQFLRTNAIKILIMDEADEMLSDSFREQIKNIIKNIPLKTQICLFSATMSKRMLEITQHFMREPEKILVEKEKLTLDGIRQFYINIENERYKFETFCELFDMILISQTMVYVNTIRKAEDLKTRLEEHNFTVSIIHSNIDYLERLEIMREFRSGKTRILISTDLLSRGIDIQQVSIVINYDLPKDKDCYIHRIGRSGRFGRKGVAINFIAKCDFRNLKELENFYKIKIEEMPKEIQEFLC